MSSKPSALWDRHLQELKGFFSEPEAAPNWGAQAYSRMLGHYYQHLIPPSASVLEIGCGRGDLLARLSNRNITGLDLSEHNIAEARQRLPHGRFEVTAGELFESAEKYDVIILSDTVDIVARNRDLFFDLSFSSDGTTEYGNLLQFKGKKFASTPYNMPVLDYTTYYLSGVTINSSGLVLADAYIFSGFNRSNRRMTPLQFRALLNKTAQPLHGSPSERLTQLKTRTRASTTTSSPTGYYLISTTEEPIPLALPTGASSVTVLGMNDQGISVGAAYTGDPNNPSIVPYYWDAHGNAYPMQLSGDLNFGYPADINSAGTVVGEVGNDITGYGAMWNTVNSTPTNINALLPSAFAFDIGEVYSIGDDFTMAVIAVPKTNSNITDYFGLNPL